jgi:hypothetical protein
MLEGQVEGIRKYYSEKNDIAWASKGVVAKFLKEKVFKLFSKRSLMSEELM